MSKVRTIYKALRSILFTGILVVVGVYVLTYIALSIPYVEKKIKNKVENFVGDYLGTEVIIGDLEVYPFNEVRLHNLTVKDKNCKVCVHTETLGAGISLWRLIFKGEIEITYGEISGMDANIYQAAENAPLNIQFIIDAFKPKDKNKPPTQFDLKLHNIVIRKSSIRFNRTYIPDKKDGSFDPNHIYISDLKADITVPVLKNNNFKIDCRRFSFNEKSGFDLEDLSFVTHITDKSIKVENLCITLPGTKIAPSDLSLSFDNFSSIADALKTGNHQFILINNTIDPQDFACFLPMFGRIGCPFTLDMDVNGNLNQVNISTFHLYNNAKGLDISCKAKCIDLLKKRAREIEISPLECTVDYDNLPQSSKQLLLALNDKISEYTSRIGSAHFILNGKYSEPQKRLIADIDLDSSVGNISADIESGIEINKKVILRNIRATLAGDNINLGKILDNNKLGLLSINLNGDMSSPDKNCDASVDVDISSIVFNGKSFDNITANINKDKNLYNAVLNVDDEDYNLNLEAEYTDAGKESKLNVTADIIKANLRSLQLESPILKYNYSGIFKADISGNDINNLSGNVNISNLNLYSKEKKLKLNRVDLFCDQISDNNRKIILESDWLTLSVSGMFRYADIVPTLNNELAQVFPALMKPVKKEYLRPINMDYTLKLYSTETPYKFFDIKYYPLADVIISGDFDSEMQRYTLSASAPFIKKSDGKVIRGGKLEVSTDHQHLNTDFSLILPIKNGVAPVGISLNAFNNDASADITWDLQSDKKIKAGLRLNALLRKNELSSVPDIDLEIKKSEFYLKEDKWNIDPVKIKYDGTTLDVGNMKVWHEGQFIDINGKVSNNPEDKITVELASIDVDYIFNFLNINYVTFGGMATGKVVGSELLTSSPKASTEYLHIKDLSYNEAVLGDGDITGKWINKDKKVSIYADIKENGRRRALVDGGIWVTRDSLAFAMSADSINVRFLQPFMKAFSTDIEGRASGKANLYGTFKDIDLAGRLHADTIRMRLDYTNVYYSGADSVIINPGHIDISQFKLYDPEGNTAILSGWLNHNYFHEPSFRFTLNDAESFLCYNTNKSLNPDWYGKIYGSGRAILNGRPGFVSLDVDMTTTAGSTFTFELNDTQVAEDYNFLSFSDRKKEELIAESAAIQLEDLSAKNEPRKQEEESNTIFSMELRGAVTNGTEVIIVMDTKAGDKIRAWGKGAMQISYDTESDNMKIYGKYILERGNYNFSLQDLILRDFTILPESSISFNGDPLRADLNISASYRVNTNLSDLDKSFASDKELNRTNVPVDAILKLNGDMTHPDISFDIEMPTLTQDVVRKVKSIISTEDMMNRQIIYLLALNRFYTPEYMGGSNGGGELASVASSTISSQLANMMGQLTNKVSVAPSIRSDKGDFSDMEVDLALSSHLFNNRLLINGNFGYRDRSSSQTTFVGDFDIEYLLSKGGNLRLKAYNHFNDQNYYLRSALTTQGVGIVYRRDFDNPFTFLKRKKKEYPDTVPVADETDNSEVVPIEK